METLKKFVLRVGSLVCIAFLIWAIAWIDREVGSGTILADLLFCFAGLGLGIGLAGCVSLWSRA